MSLTTTNDIQSRRITNSQLARIASNAAVEFDCYLRGRDFGFDAAAELALSLQSEIKEINEPPAPASLLNPSVAIVTNRAIKLSEWTSNEITSVSDLVSKTTEISNKLKFVKDQSADETKTKDILEKLRNFCVELSRAAAEQRSSIEDALPEHPYRR